MLTERQIELIRQSANQLNGNGVVATNIFYSNLFAEAPQVRPLFPEDMFRQSEKLWALLLTMVESLEDLGSLRPELLALGRRHDEYGAKAEHYPLVASTLVETLASLVPEHWSPDHAEAWEKALTEVSEVMLEGADGTAE